MKQTRGNTDAIHMTSVALRHFYTETQLRTQPDQNICEKFLSLSESLQRKNSSNPTIDTNLTEVQLPATEHQIRWPSLHPKTCITNTLLCEGKLLLRKTMLATNSLSWATCYVITHAALWTMNPTGSFSSSTFTVLMSATGNRDLKRMRFHRQQQSRLHTAWKIKE